MRPPFVLVLLASLTVLAGYASTETGGRPIPTGGPTPPVITFPPPFDPPVEASEVADVYVGALGGASLRGSSPVVFVKDHAYCSQMLHVAPCDPVEISERVQQDVLAQLGPRVRFSDDPPEAPELKHVIVVTLGPAHIAGDRATVTVESFCGPLCGYGETQVLERHGDAWKRTGSTGPSWIS